MRRRDEAGMTVVEVLAASGLAAVILAAIATATFQIAGATGRGEDRLATQHDHSNAFAWLARDARLAVADDSTVLPASVTLRWTDPGDGSDYISSYTQSGNDLVRTLTVDSTTTMQTVARNLDPAGFGASLSGQLLTVTLTSTAGTSTQTRTELVLMRPSPVVATPTWIPTPAPCQLSVSDGPSYSGGGRRVSFDITNGAGGGTRALESIEVTWDSDYDDLRRVRWDGGVVWSGNQAPPSASLSSLSGTIDPGETVVLQFQFRHNGHHGPVDFVATFSGPCTVGN